LCADFKLENADKFKEILLCSFFSRLSESPDEISFSMSEEGTAVCGIPKQRPSCTHTIFSKFTVHGSQAEHHQRF
jgi:hypothetical protein